MEIAIWIFVLFGITAIAYSSINLMKIFSCKKQIDAYCMGTDKEISGFRYGKDLFLTFSYRYEGKDYYRASKLGVTMKLYNSLKKGERYKIYINENKPEMYVVKRKATMTEIISLIMGIFLLLAATFMYAFMVM